MSFLKKVALITGGARGFGKGFGREVCENGGKVSIVDMLKEEGQATAKEFNDNYGPTSATFLKCDVSNQEDMASAFSETKSLFGNIDFVINNAGIAGQGLASPLWKKVLDIDLMAVVHGNILAEEYMSIQKGGRGGVVINVASTAGLTAVPPEPVYAAAKHGVVGLSRSVAPGFLAAGIRVACLCPSFAKTRLVTDILDAAGTDPSAAAFKTWVEDLGFIQVSDVIRAFRHVVDSGVSGAVLTITPAGIEYKYPKNMKGKL